MTIVQTNAFVLSGTVLSREHRAGNSQADECLVGRRDLFAEADDPPAAKRAKVDDQAPPPLVDDREGAKVDAPASSSAASAASAAPATEPRAKRPRGKAKAKAAA